MMASMKLNTPPRICYRAAMARPLFLLAVLALGACGGSSSPAAPTPTYPQVAGSYSGTIAIAFPEIPTSVSCFASTAVTQSGSSVNIAPIVLGSSCANMSIPMGPQTIDTTGAITGSQTGTFPDTCGTYTYTASGGFFGRELRLSITATSRTCYNFNFTAVLTR